MVETNVHGYPLLRFHEAPAAIDVHFIDRPGEVVTGLGELALPPVAPAPAGARYRYKRGAAPFKTRRTKRRGPP